MDVLGYAFVYLFILVVFVRALRNTVYGVNFRNRVFCGILIARELFLLVLLGAISLRFGPASMFRTFYATNQIISDTTPIIFLVVFILILPIIVFSRFVFQSELWVRGDIGSRDSVRHQREQIRSLIRSCFVLLVGLLLVGHILGLRNAMLSAIA